MTFLIAFSFSTNLAWIKSALVKCMEDPKGNNELFLFDLLLCKFTEKLFK